MTTSTAPPVATLPGIDWVEIPGGDYIYQDGKSRTLPTFYMARHPITNVRYQAFIDAGGYDDERWWQGIEPDTSGDARVLRGGSWYGNPHAVRSAERNWNDPGERVDNVGFRLVSSGPIR
ncbi:MAG: SUMF1/EgtB/PvdO family nonheme iron enzyme [Accumulibacter sp.]|jgi:formylglycine-generating enzyme required for sulfatase activity|uniref:SUMF1/EgtB/PvdO family nonheme iron enzyme n=1 Tax=Accumulibacter sp. TaxID=2053492 RepID=UPI002FC37B24